MAYRDYRSQLDPSETGDPALRRNVFRAMASDFLSSAKEGAVTDRAGSIARMMEAAFKAGQASTPTLAAKGKAPPRRTITDMDIPPLPRRELTLLRIILFGEYEGHAGRDPEPVQLALWMSPKVPGFPSTLSSDRWRVPGSGTRGFSNKTVLPLVKAGLYEATGADGEGYRYARLTEWGYELLATGRTAHEEGRRPGTSATYRSYAALVGSRRLQDEADAVLGQIRERLGPRPNGFGR